MHRAGSPLAPVEHVEADIGGDAVEPRPECGPPFKLIEVAPRTDHRLLYGVLRVESRSEHPVGVASQLPPVLLQFRGVVCRGALAPAGGGCEISHPRTLLRAVPPGSTPRYFRPDQPPAPTIRQAINRSRQGSQLRPARTARPQQWEPPPGAGTDLRSPAYRRGL